MDRLWTPWRMDYVGGGKPQGCIFCAKPAAGDDRDNLILHRGAGAFAIMNLFPYNTGHLMLVPYAHAAALPDVPPDALSELMALLAWTTAVLQRVLRNDGFNAGLNIGAVAGAGVADHLHMHVVPRWVGDANYMPILANTMVLPELIPVTYAKLKGEMARTPFPATEDRSGVREQAGGVAVDGEGRVALRLARDGAWVFPKGHIEPGEASFAAAVREVAEETGLAATVLGWLGETRFIYKERERHVGYYLLRVAHRLPEYPEHEGRDTHLVPLAEAVERLTFPNDQEIARLAIERHREITNAERGARNAEQATRQGASDAR